MDDDNYSSEVAEAEVLADYNTGRVVLRITSPETGEMAVELHLLPELARDMAYNLTRASLAIEDSQ